MKKQIENYLLKTKVKRHEGGGRWYSQGESNNWKPSVTTIIGETCSKGKFFDEWLMKHGNNAKNLRDKAAEQGTAVHENIELLLKGEEVLVQHSEIGRFNDDKKANEFVQKALMSFEKFYEENHILVETQEIFLYHKDIPWAGTPDIIADVNGRLSMIDIKTGDYRKTHEIQQLMYVDLWDAIFPDNPIQDIYGLYVKGKWIKEPNYQFRKFTRSVIHHNVYNLWCYLNFPYGKPKPKHKAKLKEVFKLGDSCNGKSIEQLL
tara:strand:- start:4121 stop:4906 length:786 start_codon:yes stop_codon:yes gene_type:complete